MNQRLPRAIADTNTVRKRTEVIRDGFCFKSSLNIDIFPRLSDIGL